MSFWNSLGDTLVTIGLAEKVDAPTPEAAIEEAKATAVAAASPPPKVAAAMAAVPAPTPDAPKSPSIEPELVKNFDDLARKQLIAAMEGSGASLVEDLEMLLSTLRENITDETALYKSALKILIKQGHSIDAIRQDFDKCIGALEDEDRQFGVNLKRQMEGRVGSRIKEVTACNEAIQAKQAQIEQLQTEIAELASKAHEAQGEVTGEQAKLDLAQSRFTLNYNALKSQIESHSGKVMQYGEGL